MRNRAISGRACLHRREPALASLGPDLVVRDMVLASGLSQCQHILGSSSTAMQAPLGELDLRSVGAIMANTPANEWIKYLGELD